MGHIKVPGTPARRSRSAVSGTMAGAFRVLARRVALEWRDGAPRFAAMRSRDASGATRLESVAMPTLEALVVRGLATVRHEAERRVYALSADGRALAGALDLSDARRDEALAAELDAAVRRVA